MLIWWYGRSFTRSSTERQKPAIEEGTIAVEFLRPPTLQALQQRLSDAKHPPIHILHFDGHGVFGTVPVEHKTDPTQVILVTPTPLPKP